MPLHDRHPELRLPAEEDTATVALFTGACEALVVLDPIDGTLHHFLAAPKPLRDHGRARAQPVVMSRRSIALPREGPASSRRRSGADARKGRAGRDTAPTQRRGRRQRRDRLGRLAGGACSKRCGARASIDVPDLWRCDLDRDAPARLPRRTALDPELPRGRERARTHRPADLARIWRGGAGQRRGAPFPDTLHEAFSGADRGDRRRRRSTAAVRHRCVAGALARELEQQLELDLGFRTLVDPMMRPDPRPAPDPSTPVTRRPLPSCSRSGWCARTKRALPSARTRSPQPGTKVWNGDWPATSGRRPVSHARDEPCSYICE